MLVTVHILGIILVASVTLGAALLIAEGAVRLYNWLNRRR